MNEQETLRDVMAWAREEVRRSQRWMLAGMVAFLAAGVGWTIWWAPSRAVPPSAPGVPDRMPTTDPAGHGWSDLTRRVEELEAQNRTLVQLLAPRASTEPAWLEAAAPAADPAPRSRSLAAKPELAAPEPATTAPREVLPKAPTLRAVPLPREAQVREASKAEPPADEPLPVAAAPLPGSDAEVQPAAPTRLIPVDELVRGFDVLLADSGLRQYHLMEARHDPVSHQLRDVVLAVRGSEETLPGTFCAATLDVEYDPVLQRGALVLLSVHEVRDGKTFSLPGNEKRIEIPGRLPPTMIPAALVEAFGLEQRGNVERIGRGQALVEKYNKVLRGEPHVALRIRSIDREVDRELHDVWIDLAFDSTGKPLQSLHAERAWWVLHEDSQFVELQCEGGEMVREGVATPLFRGRYRQAMRGIQPALWKSLRAVHPTTEGAPASDPQESS